MTAYYNEIEPYAADWLENLIRERLIAPGVVDRRSIVDVQPADLAGFAQCHFFAGIGGWSLAARLAGWPDERDLWTGSCPCQPFSVAGKGAGQADARHLWPEFFRLIAGRRPDVVMGEQVAAAVGKAWLDGVCADLEGVGYAVGAAVVPACAVDAPHRRDRLWFVADASGERRRRGQGPEDRHDADRANAGWIQGDGRPTGICEDDRRRSSPLADADRKLHDRAGRVGQGRRVELTDCGPLGDADAQGRLQPGGPLGEVGRRPSDASAWSEAGWLAGADGKVRRVEPGIRLLAHGVPARVAKLRAFGNAIVPQVAAEIIGAYLDCAPTGRVRLTCGEGVFG